MEVTDGPHFGGGSGNGRRPRTGTHWPGALDDLECRCLHFPQAGALHAHGLLTRLADTAKNRAGRLPVGKQPRAR
jgi:hypothetical protein